MKKLLIVVPFIVSAATALAQVNTAPLPGGKFQNVKENIPERRENIKENIQERRENIKENIQERRENIKENIQSRHEEIRRNLEQRREEAKMKAEELREAAKQRMEALRSEAKEKIEAKRVELRERLKTIKDEKKKQAVERVYANLNELNEKATKQMLETLGKIDEALGRIGSRADKAEANGLDVSSAREAIAAAESAIAASRTAVSNQAAKTYEVPAIDENSLRTDIGAIRQALHRDLTAARETVKDAHDAVRRAAVALAQIPRVNEPVATSTPAVESPATTTAPVQ